MGRKTLIGWACALVLAGTALPAHADGFVVEKARATFGVARSGLPKHQVRMTGRVTSSRTVDAFDPERHGLRVKVGDFVAVAHTPDGEGPRFKFKRHVWRMRSKVNGVRTKLNLDTRSGRLKVDVKKANASLLRDGGPQYVECTVEIGTGIVGDAVVFDERGRGRKWISLAQGTATAPPGTPPIGERPAQGTLVYEILARGERSEVLQPGVQVAMNEADWIDLYDQATITTFNKRPDVDFKQEMVIAVFAGLVSQVHEQEIDLVAVTDTADQLHVSWRSRYGCFQFACSGGLNDPNACPDFAPFLFVRVRRVSSPAVSNRAPSIYDDCPK